MFCWQGRRRRRHRSSSTACRVQTKGLDFLSSMHMCVPVRLGNGFCQTCETFLCLRSLLRRRSVQKPNHTNYSTIFYLEPLFLHRPILVSCEEGSVPGSSTVGCRSVRRVPVPANIITFSPGTLPDAAENAQLFCTAKEIMLLAFVFCRIDTCDTHTAVQKNI